MVKGQWNAWLVARGVVKVIVIVVELVKIGCGCDGVLDVRRVG